MRVAVLMLSLAACSSSEPFERSCNGKTVPNCLPYELSIIESASLSPEEVTIEDPLMMVDVRVQLMRCEMLDRAHEVTIEMRAGTEEMPRILDLVTVRDDGMDGDAVAMDGLIEKTIENPFFGAEIPANSDVFLRFQAASACRLLGRDVHRRNLPKRDDGSAVPNGCASRSRRLIRVSAEPDAVAETDAAASPATSDGGARPPARLLIPERASPRSTPPSASLRDSLTLNRSQCRRRALATRPQKEQPFRDRAG